MLGLAVAILALGFVGNARTAARVLAAVDVEMERQDLQIPLLIGGATTSRAHTAVKVSPRRTGPVVWVKDASRSVPVAAALLDNKQRPALLEATEKDYASLRERHAQKSGAADADPGEGPRQPDAIEWDGYTPPVAPAQGLGVREFLDYDVAELREYIDWQPFFNAWEMKGVTFLKLKKYFFSGKDFFYFF